MMDSKTKVNAEDRRREELQAVTDRIVESILRLDTIKRSIFTETNITTADAFHLYLRQQQILEYEMRILRDMSMGIYPPPY